MVKDEEMESGMIKATLIIPVTYNKRNNSGCFLTEYDVKKAINNVHEGVPIVYDNGVVIGATTSSKPKAKWNHELNICEVKVDVILWNVKAQAIKYNDCIGYTIREFVIHDNVS